MQKHNIEYHCSSQVTPPVCPFDYRFDIHDLDEEPASDADPCEGGELYPVVNRVLIRPPKRSLYGIDNISLQ
jgi:hypothetical protein